jgi:hypothetical protein
MKLRLTISIFSSFIHSVVGLFILKTNIEGITIILLVTHFDRVINKFFVFDTKMF